MIIDSHTHAWDHWPYDPPVPDPESRGKVEQLLWEMDRNGVDQAVLVCARIDHNPHNNHYVAECVRKYPKRLIQFADVDCSWTETYHTPGAAARLQEAAAQYQLKGFTHYLKDDYGWFDTAEGQAFFAKAAEVRLIASLALGPGWMPALRKLAQKYPAVPFLLHHMAGAKADEPNPPTGLKEIVATASLPNVYLKLSGFHYVSSTAWDYPQKDTHGVVRQLYDAFGPKRLCWGSDYPVVRFFMTYQQSLEAFRRHCDFIPSSEHKYILGENLDALLQAAGT